MDGHTPCIEYSVFDDSLAFTFGGCKELVGFRCLLVLRTLLVALCNRLLALRLKLVVLRGDLIVLRMFDCVARDVRCVAG